MPQVHLGAVDSSILIFYLLFVIGIGFFLTRITKTSKDFFHGGRRIPAWVTGLAFLSANLGAQEVIGMGASGAKYGIETVHFYWIGAIPAMVFVGVFMMPFYYGSKARSVPEYLKLRYDEKTRAFNAFSFAIMTLFSSGISMYATALLLNTLLGWSIPVCMLASAAFVLVYIFLGGLTSAIYNEVLQFFLIVFGFFPLVLLGLKNVGGWDGLTQKLSIAAVQRGFQPGAFTHSWQGLTNAHNNPFGVDWFGLVMGLGFVLSFGYWCTDFLVVQCALAAKDMSAARRTPLIASVPKMLFPFVVILPGMIAMALTATSGSNGFHLPLQDIHRPELGYNYNMAAPSMLIHYYPTGLLGLGLTALIASFMSGMAGNVTAFNTVFTIDIYEGYIRPGQSDQHYVNVGRAATVGGIILSIGTAVLAENFNNIMDMLQLVFAFVNAPLFATFLLGMFWKRTTGHGAFFGLLGGTLAAAVHQGLTLSVGDQPGVHGGFLGTVVHTYPSEMAQNFWTAIFAWSFCFIATIAISLLTKRTKTDEELTGLVYSLTPKAIDPETTWYKKPAVLGVVVIVAAAILNIIFR